MRNLLKKSLYKEGFGCQKSFLIKGKDIKSIRSKLIYNYNMLNIKRMGLMDELELLCFQIISAAGTARSNFIQAIQEVKKGKNDKTEELMKEGEQQFLQGHNIHATLLQKEASGENWNGSVLLMHAEDQLMSAELFQILSKEFINTYRRLIDLEQKAK
jgi:PTS system cellobiose-specific IIA component